MSQLLNCIYLHRYYFVKNNPKRYFKLTPPASRRSYVFLTLPLPSPTIQLAFAKIALVSNFPRVFNRVAQKQ